MSRWTTLASWDDCPHLSEQSKKDLWDSIPPYQRDARSRGIPQLGSGAIYPVLESDYVVEDLRVIPPEWPRCFGLDVGWLRTAACWIARDPETGILYVYSEHYMGKEEPAIHAAAIRSRGDWISGWIDPAARGRGQRDGEQLFQNYRDLGLAVQPAVNAVEAGIFVVWQLLSGGMLKVFKSLGNMRQELRLYRRDENGKVVKSNDHLCDALRYAVLSGRDSMSTKPVPIHYERSKPIGVWS